VPGTQLVVVGAAIVRAGRVLAARRAEPRDGAGRWELPGGKVDPGESDEQALVRECAEELGVTIDVGARIGPQLPIPQIDGVLRLYLARVTAGEPQALEHSALRWVGPAELAELDWLPTDLEAVAAVQAHLHREDGC